MNKYEAETRKSDNLHKTIRIVLEQPFKWLDRLCTMITDIGLLRSWKFFLIVLLIGTWTGVFNGDQAYQLMKHCFDEVIIKKDVLLYAVIIESVLLIIAMFIIIHLAKTKGSLKEKNISLTQQLAGVNPLLNINE